MKHILKIIIGVILIFILLASFVDALCAADYRSSQTSNGLISKIRNIRKNKVSGKFIRINKETLRFEGYIDKDTYKKYLKYIDPNVKVLVITSPGGDTNSGVKMGLDIYKRKLTVVVEGVAASSAANYLFLGARKKIIQKGFVGFHGNAQALLSQMGGFDGLKKDMKKNSRVSYEYFIKFKKELEETIGLEKEFYKKLNIPQKFFDITQDPGKGVTADLNENFDFLLPSLKTMERYNVMNVSGQQDVGLAETLGIKVIYY